ncbi:MAG: hypothetical protein M3161_06995, partial [Actinomycetota bacterium]|nr:hypothetical protein [Actinomycetota bacterium]
ISLSRKQTMAGGESSSIPEEEGGLAGRTTAADTGDADEGEAEMELEAREASEAVGVATEDTIVRPETEAEIVSGLEGAPELLPDAITPEAAPTADRAAQTAPAEEREEAEMIALMSPDSPPEARSDALPTEEKERHLDRRVNMEEPEEGAAPGDAIAALDAEEIPLAEGAEALGGEPLEPQDETGEESLESIVEDLKRERGQS